MNSRRKILFIVTQSEFGGAQRFIYSLVTNLNREKYDILTAAGPEGGDAGGLLFTLKERNFGVVALKFLKRNINPFFDIRAFFEIKNLIKKEKPDIVFLCSTKAGFLGSFAAKLAKVEKIIYRIGGWTFNDPWPNWKKKLYIWLEKLSAKWKDYIINNAESDRQQAVKLGIKPKKKILTIYNGGDVKTLDFLLNKREITENFLKPYKNQIHDSDIKIGTVANFYPPKGLEYLIEAANLLKEKNIKFLIVGDGQERKKIEELINKYNLNNFVFLLGHVFEAYKYLKVFDIFVLPSVKEGFPWTILEAMAAEVPVIATKVGAVPEIIENNKNGILVEPRNSRALAEAIENLINDRNLRDEIAKEGRKTVVEKFNLEKMIKEYENLFFID